MKPLVSILIPAYNAGEWLADTLRSAIAQTWENKEIIVVDDGSKDNTLEVARKFESEFVRVYTQKNQGAAATRNQAFSLAKGDYIQWLDADDLLSPDKIALQMEVAERLRNPRLLFSSGWGQFLYRYSRTQFVPTPLWADLSPAEWLIRKMGNNLHMQTATWLVSRELTEAAGPWRTDMAVDDDGEYFCRVLMKSEGIHFVPESKVYYRASGHSSLSYIGNSNAKRESQWLSMRFHIECLRSLEDTPRVKKACVTYMQNWLTFFYPERLDLIEEMQKLAGTLDGSLYTPQLSWKYSWLKPIFGLEFAKRASIFVPRLKWSVLRFWDKMLFHLVNRNAIASNT